MRPKAHPPLSPNELESHTANTSESRLVSSVVQRPEEVAATGLEPAVIVWSRLWRLCGGSRALARAGIRREGGCLPSKSFDLLDASLLLVLRKRATGKELHGVRSMRSCGIETTVGSKRAHAVGGASPWARREGRSSGEDGGLSSFSASVWGSGSGAGSMNDAASPCGFCAQLFRGLLHGHPCCQHGGIHIIVRTRNGRQEPGVPSAGLKGEPAVTTELVGR